MVSLTHSPGGYLSGWTVSSSINKDYYDVKYHQRGGLECSVVMVSKFSLAVGFGRFYGKNLGFAFGFGLLMKSL